MADFPIPRAELIALFVESLLFGAFSILYFISIWILVYREKTHSRSRLNKWMLATATAMFILALIHLIFDVIRAIDGFIVNGGTPDGTLAFYGQLDHPTEVGKTSVYVLQTLIGDSFVSYRLFIVYNRSLWVLVLPTLLLMATAVSGVATCVEMHLLTNAAAIFTSSLQPWITSFFSLSLTTNVLATLMITARIVWSNYRVQKYRTGYAAVTLWNVVETIVQSAAIYSAALISLLACYVADNNAQYICLDALQPIIGIVFTLIIIRVGISETANLSSKGGHSVSAGDTRTAPVPIGHGQQQYPMRPLAINVSVARTRDRDIDSFENYDQKDVVHVPGTTRKDVDLESGESP